MIRLVQPGETPSECAIADQARAALESILKENPVCITILFEAPKGQGWASIPNAGCVARGLIESAADRLECGEEE